MTTELHANEIPWRLQPWTPEPADPDPLVASILDGMAYRLVMLSTLEALHDLHRQHDRLQAAHQRLEDAYRYLRELTMEKA